jgi:hypothetical protein
MIAGASTVTVDTHGRKQLLSLVDSLVAFFNSADLESLLSTLAVRCCDNVTVKTCLEAPESTNNRKSLAVLTADDRVVPYITPDKSVASVTFVWALLYAAHPDGVMKVIDKRICYRTYKAATTMQGAPAEVSALPFSVLEVVVSMCGNCVIPQLLQQVLARAVQTSCVSPQLVVESQAKSRANPGVVEYRQSPAKKASETTNNRGAAVESDTPSVFQNVNNLVAEYALRRRAHTPDQGSNAVMDDPTALGGRWRYLIEFRLQFDEHDLVTHWTTTILSAEPEEILLKPQLRL